MSHSAEPDEYPSTRATEDVSSNANEAPRPAAQRISSRWAVVIPTAIAVVALGVAAWALLRPPPDTHSSPTAQQVAEAKGRACAAYTTVRTAVALQTGGAANADPAAAQTVATNARLAMAVGSQHLVDNLSPAVPSELAGLMHSIASDLQGLTITALAGAADDDANQVARLHDLEANSVKVVEQCK
jgi:hypothetical protein